MKEKKPNEKPRIELLKTTRHWNGKRFDNLMLRINGGNPIEITLARFNPKLKNFLLAMATDCEVVQQTLVRMIDEKAE